MPTEQWRSVGFWCPGQKVKLAPLFLIFFQKNFQIAHPKQIKVIFKSDKQKPICAKWLVFYYLLFFISGQFQHPPQVAPGAHAPLPSPSAMPLLLKTYI